MSYKIELTRKALKNLSKISSKYQMLIIYKLELLQDLLTVKIFKLTDKGERISLEKVKKELQILNGRK